MLKLIKGMNFVMLLCFGLSIYSQTNADLNFFDNSISMIYQKKLKTKEIFKENLKGNGSEIQYFATGLFFIYKEFISSQDFNSCAFYPSCSVYGLECVKKHGLMNGSIMTFDRLTRCNGFSPEKYEKDYKKNLFIDPLEN